MSERRDQIAPLLERLDSDIAGVRFVDAEAVRRRGRARSRHQALGAAVTAVVVVALVAAGAGLLRPGGGTHSAPPASQVPATATSAPAPSISSRFATLPTVAEVTTALHGCCGTVTAADLTTPTGDCLSAPLTAQGSPVPARRMVATGDGGLVVAVTLYGADAGTVGGQLQEVYRACETAAGHRKSFDQPGTTVGGARLVAVTGQPAGGGVAQQYAGWAPAAGQVEVLVQISFTGNGDLGPTQVERLLQAAVAAAKG